MILVCVVWEVYFLAMILISRGFSLSSVLVCLILGIAKDLVVDHTQAC